MIVATEHKIDPKILLGFSFSFTEQKNTINKPTGNFFYDPWIIKEEYKNTIWETIYNSLNLIKGEARIISLNPKESYMCHSDIDDRYHLNLRGEESYLIDLENKRMYETVTDGIWYDMNAGYRHTASNYGRTIRQQLVVRQLLIRGTNISTKVKITTKPEFTRYYFDYYISPWLNKQNKLGNLNNFNFDGTTVFVDIANIVLNEFIQLTETHNYFIVNYE